MYGLGSNHTYNQQYSYFISKAIDCLTHKPNSPMTLFSSSMHGAIKKAIPKSQA